MSSYRITKINGERVEVQAFSAIQATFGMQGVVCVERHFRGYWTQIEGLSFT